MFVVPEPYIPKIGARVMSLQDPENKMSKSDDNENAYVSLIDSPETILRKFKRAVTDSDAVNPVRVSEQKPGVSNLIRIYAALNGVTTAAVEREFDGKGYGAFKPAVAECVIQALQPIQKKYNELLFDKSELMRQMAEGAQKAENLAQRTLGAVYEKIGFVKLT